MVVLRLSYQNFAGMVIETIWLNGYVMRCGVHFVPEF